MMSDAGELSVSMARVQRLLDVLSLAAIDAFDDERLDFAAEGEGPFAMLEETVRLFVQELGRAAAERAHYVEELEAQRAALEDKLRTIEEQQASIQQLSTPVLELDDDVLTLPIIGAVDARRAALMTDALLERTRQAGARFVIVDVTGAALFDQETAAHLKKMVHAARMLGATTLLAGMGPTLSMLAVRNGVEFEGVPAFRGLKEALRFCRGKLRGGAQAAPVRAARDARPSEEHGDEGHAVPAEGST